MVRLTAVLFLVSISGLAAQAIHPAPNLPDGWRMSGDAVDPDEPVTLQLSLQKRNLDKLYQMAYAVSDPSGPDYGRYLSSAELDALTAPSASDLATVEAWLAAANVPFSRMVGEESVEAKLTVASASALLGCNFTFVVCDFTGQRALRASDYVLPRVIDETVTAVYGMHGLPLPPRATAPNDPSKPTPLKVTPAVIRKTYNIKGGAVTPSNKTRQAVAEFQGQTMKVSDLKTFFKKFVHNWPTGADTVHKFVGKHDKGDGGVEASLDIEYIMGVAPGLSTEFWYYGGQDFCKDLKTWTSRILNGSNPPLVHSVSYGWQGALSGIGCKTNIVKDVDTNFAKLAAKGITIIFASGDSGSGYSPTSNNPEAAKLYPSWPASSPWVTAVGSTRFVDNKAQPEMATDQFGSGGGFSTMFDAFKDQQAAVKQYLAVATKLPPQKMFPAGGRATPDVSGLGEGYQVVSNGQTMSVGGTSASTPMFASLVSLLNEGRRKAGKQPMGYLNPWLYQHPDMFTDVTVGTNAIGRDGSKVKYGFECAKGWDPATGLGSPIFDKMLAAAGVEAELADGIVIV